MSQQRQNGEVVQASREALDMAAKEGVLKIEVSYDPATQQTGYVASPASAWKNTAFLQHVLEMAAELAEFHHKQGLVVRQQQAAVEQMMRDQIAAQQQANIKKLVQGK